jgi:hypothetical protein
MPNTVISGEGTAVQQSTTTFNADAELVSATLMKASSIMPSLRDTSTDNIRQDIISFLGKPIKLTTGTFKTTDTYSTFGDYIVPAQVIAAGGPLFTDKLRGLLGFRATIVLKLVVNANPFQQGRYNLQFHPTGGADNSATSTTFAAANINTLVQRSQMPHVELDLACDTEAVISYPYVSVLNYTPTASFNAGTHWGNIGFTRIYPYSPLAFGTGSAEAAYTLWAYFQDIELIGAAYPQSGRGFNTSVRSKKNESEIEQDSSNMGPVSSALIRVRDASSILSAVPLLSSYATSVSWFSDIAAQAAAVFGWSKPLNLEHSMRMTQNVYPYMANTDGPDESFPLSLSYKNQVGSAPGFSGTDVDETDFSFLATVPAYSQTLLWGLSTVAGTSLLSENVTPIAGVSTRTVASTTIYNFAPHQFLATFFRKWRGSMVYKLKIVKTSFHSGRLIVAFSPTEVPSAITAAPTYLQTDYLHREIIDIRTGNEFTFVVPFVSSTPYKETTGLNNYTGTINIFVLDALAAPDTVSPNIAIILEKCMGPDVEFAIPCAPGYAPMYGVSPQGDFGSAENSVDMCQRVDKTIGSSIIKYDGSSNSLYCIGEKISSVRSLAKLPCVLPYVAPAPTPASFTNILPFINTVFFTNGTVNTFPLQLPDTIALFSSCYVYSRGGVRIKFLEDGSLATGTPAIVSLKTFVNTPTVTQGLVASQSATDVTGSATFVDRINNPSMIYRQGLSAEVQCPQYSNVHSRLNCDLVSNTNLATTNSIRSTNPKYSITRFTTPLTNPAYAPIIYRSASDDFNFGSFLSIPPMVAIVPP